MVAAEAKIDRWVKRQVRIFEQKCQARSRGGYPDICHVTASAPDDWNISLLSKKLHQTVQGLGFCTSSVQICWKRCMTIDASWGDLRDANKGPREGPRGGHSQTCAWAPLRQCFALGVWGSGPRVSGFRALEASGLRCIVGSRL